MCEMRMMLSVCGLRMTLCVQDFQLGVGMTYVSMEVASVKPTGRHSFSLITPYKTFKYGPGTSLYRYLSSSPPLPSSLPRYLSTPFFISLSLSLPSPFPLLSHLLSLLLFPSFSLYLLAKFELFNPVNNLNRLT